jgi:uncharacterized protein YukE
MSDAMKYNFAGIEAAVSGVQGGTMSPASLIADEDAGVILGGPLWGGSGSDAYQQTQQRWQDDGEDPNLLNFTKVMLGTDHDTTSASGDVFDFTAMEAADGAGEGLPSAPVVDLQLDNEPEVLAGVYDVDLMLTDMDKGPLPASMPEYALLIDLM